MNGSEKHILVCQTSTTYFRYNKGWGFIIDLWELVIKLPFIDPNSTFLFHQFITAHFKYFLKFL